MRSEIDRIFDDHKARTDALFDKFKADVHTDIAVRSKQIANRVLAVFGILLILAATAAVSLALVGATINWPWK